MITNVVHLDDWLRTPEQRVAARIDKLVEVSKCIISLKVCEFQAGCEQRLMETASTHMQDDSMMGLAAVESVNSMLRFMGERRSATGATEFALERAMRIFL